MRVFGSIFFFVEHSTFFNFIPEKTSPKGVHNQEQKNDTITAAEDTNTSPKARNQSP
jgi:hypothetical protein